jgi:GntR family transcriptional regulator, transcriptional repressor for pyruvate dehydrogenase complex
MTRMTEPDTAGLAPLPRRRLYEQIAQQLLAHIRTTGLRPGDRLPPERELAARLGVSRASIAQALVALEILGVVNVRHGNGAVIVSLISDHQVVEALRAHASRLPEIIEARAALEVKLASLAAVRRTEVDVEAIDRALEIMEADVRVGGRGIEGDEAFHAAVTAAGHSSLLARLMQEISDLIAESRVESLGQPGRPAQSLAGHRAIAEAIRAGDAAAAAAAMEEHISLVSDVAMLKEDEALVSD